MEQGKNRGAMFKLAIVWLAIILLGSFWLTMRETSAPVSMTVIPQAPREGDPVIATFKVNNPSADGTVIRYQFFTNGELIEEGATTVAPGSSKTFKYAYENPLQMGEQLNFMVRTRSNLGGYEKVLSTPPYPPQVWASFVSFASLSTSVMSSMTTMTYYQSTFPSELGLNVGVVISIILIVLLVFMELTQPVLAGRAVATLRRLKISFSAATWILLIIFLGMVYTRIVMFIAG